MRYSELASDARAHGYHTIIIPIQSGSQEVVEESGLEDFKNALSMYWLMSGNHFLFNW